jgi:hypothetical protein
MDKCHIDSIIADFRVAGDKREDGIPSVHRSAECGVHHGIVSTVVQKFVPDLATR